MRVLLTGAGGFVGSQLARLLLRKGHEVTALMAPSTSRWRIRDIERDLKIVDSDLRNLDALIPALRAGAPEVCIHLAWHGWAGQAAAEENLTSLALSLQLLKLMPEIGCRRFAAAGTCFEYDLGQEWLAESTPLIPANIYPLCKKALYEIGQEFSAVTGVSVVTPRLFYSYGPFEDRRRVVPAIALSILRGEVARVTPGTQERDYLHVEDVARAIWAATESGVEGAVNIASGEPVTIAAIALLIGRLLGRPDLIALGALPHREQDPMRVVADATLLRRTIGWEPVYDLESGLRQTLDWWESHVADEVSALREERS